MTPTPPSLAEIRAAARRWKERSDAVSDAFGLTPYTPCLTPVGRSGNAAVCCPLKSGHDGPCANALGAP